MRKGEGTCLRVTLSKVLDTQNGGSGFGKNIQVLGMFHMDIRRADSDQLAGGS